MRFRSRPETKPVRRIALALAVLLSASVVTFTLADTTGGLRAPSIELPNKAGSVKFAAIGDMGTGERPQFEVAERMEACRQIFPFNFAVMLGDNIYGWDGGDGLKTKFEQPYKTLLDAGVKFHASLGNHDNRAEIYYKNFGMNGQRFYTFRKENAQFFALDTNYMDPGQLAWLKKELSESSATWKICFFHHALYSHAEMHGSDVDLRAQLEPIFVENGVKLVLAGHDHVYERLKLQKGIQYFVVGNSGKLRAGSLKRSPETAVGFDRDQCFLLLEIAGETLHFQAISRAGETVDRGEISAGGVQPKSGASAASAAAGSSR